MANNKKKQSTAQKKEQRERHNRRMDGAARIMAIFMIGIMLVFTFVTAGIFLLD